MQAKALALAQRLFAPEELDKLLDLNGSVSANRLKRALGPSAQNGRGTLCENLVRYAEQRLPLGKLLSALDGAHLWAYKHRLAVRRELGRGSFSEVYAVQDRLDNASYALKLIKSDISSHDGSFQREAAVLKFLAPWAHPNLIKLMGSFTSASKRQALVFERVRGKSLAEVRRQPAQLTLDIAKTVLRTLLTGVEFLHSKGLVHRDIKPANAIMREDGSVVLLDFGMCCSVEVGAPHYGQRTGYGGTPHYTSSELWIDCLRHRHELRSESLLKANDCWSSALTLFYVLGGTSSIQRCEEIKRRLESPTFYQDLKLFNGQHKQFEALVVVLRSALKPMHERATVQRLLELLV
jgi:serine/threonine protein kinase